MGKIKNAFYRFMYGRYGNDTLNSVLMLTYCVFIFAYIIVSMFVEINPFVYLAYLFATWTLIGFTFFRMMSKNITKRRAENQKFTGFFKLGRNKWRDRKTHVYRKCPSCKVVLRLPKSKGKHNVVCPKCRNRFEVRG